MARSVAKITVGILRDPEWIARSAAAQRLYALVILPQPKLSLCGYLDTIAPARWSTLAADTKPDEVQAALDELEQHRFVVIDHDTEELVVRSFVRHDLDPNRLSGNVCKGFWGSWMSISSRPLRQTIIDNCPVEYWEKLAKWAPADALQMRRSSPFERESPPPFEREAESPSETGTASPIESTLASHPSTLASRQPTVDDTPTPTGATTPQPVDNPVVAGGDPTTNDPKLRSAAEHVARHEARTRTGSDDPVLHLDSWLTDQIPRRIERHQALWTQLLTHRPHLTSIELARAIIHPNSFERDLAAGGIIDAAHAEANRNAARATGDVCQTCDGSTWITDPDQDTEATGIVIRCPDCTNPTDDLVRTALRTDD